MNRSEIHKIIALIIACAKVNKLINSLVED